MHQAFILAAGLGTRLRPLTHHRPKPLVPVCGVPLLSYALALCARHGLTEVVVNAHWLAEQVEAWAGHRDGCTVSVSVEAPDILGTGGGLRKVAGQLGQRFAVLNGDVLHDVDLTALLAAIPEGGGALALRPDAQEAPRYGVVAADEADTVVELVHLARAEARGAVRRDTHFTGIHALDRAALDRVPDGFACVVRTAYAELVPERRVAGLRYAGPWLDAGDPAAYLDANLAVLYGRVRLALDPLERAGWTRTASGAERGDRALVSGVDVRGAAWVGPGARIGAGAVLEDVVVGARAEVPAGVRLRRAVVWDGARILEGALTDAIVHDGGVHEIT